MDQKRRKTSDLWNMFDPLNHQLAKYNNAASTSDKQSQISSACSVITTELSSIKATSRGTKRQTAMSHFIPKKMSSTDKSKVDLAIMKLFTWDFQPFTMVEDKGFKNLMSICVLTKFEEICQDVKNTLSEQALSVCITTDAWTSSVNDSYCALTAHYINEHFEMKTVLLDCSVFKDSHTAENLAEYITKMVSEWNLKDKITIVISDNASNITSTVTNILKWKHYGCYAHKLNLVVQDALRHVKDVLMKVKAIVTYFKRSNAATRKLVTYQEQIGIKQPKKLLQDVVTRWNSTYFMLQRITLLEEAVKHSLALSNTDLPLLTEHEWNTCRELCMVLEPCAEVTTEMSSENYITASKIIPITRGLKFLLTKLSNDVKINSIKLVVQALLDGIATRYKHHLFEDEKTTDWIKKSTIQLIAGIISKESVMNDVTINEADTSGSLPNLESNPEKKKISIWDNYDNIINTVKLKGTSTSLAIQEVQRYMDDDLIPRKNNPLQWWKDHKHFYPNLAHLVPMLWHPIYQILKEYAEIAEAREMGRDE
ncbi:zinc finger BED domain-containing protein DAYSLEEPER-like [Sitophilus oryzae]|uniref:Zinc finger BED domain-containing protein DAYSLEEPER-like n=1 Tax=Sitophilus oryzae TaxID=7048 RepID=A0A6J2XAE3_SITOR|nr:zinc finger BED domain-containing protein DAYSLEEPER-like [Sitophilus oryzae]